MRLIIKLLTIAALTQIKLAKLKRHRAMDEIEVNTERRKGKGNGKEVLKANLSGTDGDISIQCIVTAFCAI